MKKHRKARTRRGAERHHRDAGADPSLERDAARPEDRASRRASKRAHRRRTARRSGIAREERGSDPAHALSARYWQHGRPKQHEGARRRSGKARQGQRPKGGKGKGGDKAEGERRKAPHAGAGLPVPPPRLQGVLPGDGARAADEAVRAHEPAPGSAAREDRDQRAASAKRSSSRRCSTRSSRSWRSITGQRPVRTQGEEVDRQLRPARGPGDRRGGDAARRADVGVPRPVHQRSRCRASATSAG